MVLGSPLGQMVDEFLDLVAASFPQCWCTAIVGGIGLYEIGIELMLADQEAESVTEASLTV